ncbi:MAG: hypothetical protein HY046_03175, partial [Acidobacteria bacterium]|nr:hypothetical protein [Acidobacteriota bacterium]
LRELSPEQLDAALEHERAHGASSENLKRLLLLLAPDLFPFCRHLELLNRSWVRFAEWCADDRAIRGDESRSLSLANALVRVARLGAMPRLSLLSTSLVSADDCLAERVDRLVDGESSKLEVAQRNPLRARLLVAAAVVTLAAIALQPATFLAAHNLLETILR